MTKISRTYIATGINLPVVKATQSELVTYFDGNEEGSKFGFVLKLHRQFTLKRFKNPLNCKVI
jgi:hypothetical protein